MARLLYRIFIFIYHSGIHVAALFGNQKAQQWTTGRENWEEKISNALRGINRKRIWIHCASLGEFEQGRPLIEKIKSAEPSLFIVLSFFSPSGYELRKNFPSADFVCYLPIDTQKNAKKFIRFIDPSYVIFIKYEFWLFYFEELKRKNIPLYMASAIFRESQVFFKWYGGFYRGILKNITHFFVQDSDSKKLLNDSGLQNVTITGDTRFDRVGVIVQQQQKIERIENFRQHYRIIVAGSTWPEDEDIILHVFSLLKDSGVKLIIAPHEITKNRIDEIMQKASVVADTNNIVLWSSNDDTANASILIIDTIGMLSSVYRYGTLAWIGGGFGKGIHNILEAAAFGLPVFFGPNYEKFREAKALIECGGAFSVIRKDEAVKRIANLLTDKKAFQNSSDKASTYVKENAGATEKIFSVMPDLRV